MIFRNARAVAWTKRNIWREIEMQVEHSLQESQILVGSCKYSFLTSLSIY